MKRTRVATAAAVVTMAAAVAAGCSGGDDMNHVQGHGTPPSADQQQETGQAPHNQADVTFARGMVPHHQQAIEMSRMAPDRAESPEVKALAEQIQAAQGPEIEKLTGWLQSWGVGEHSGVEHGGHGGGMMSPAEMHRLGRSSGPEFDRAFLTMMIEHHEGAIEMARTALSAGQFPEAKQMAQQIIDTQQTEIDTMKRLLAST
ncbi:DUF305 domain-containing protein [Saccharopolyspora rhizosphaerae]|uniref:DUF305 domain-containing protein n=1 Tax=Saccharopolyspora rhizosphaerae TaxID=2492662 RepID=A0A426JP05_9PSEU|nr:DUF305 domain-containing protein [Saccharopolyspora rhizosphaerae]RRO14948.1 DUF305 domain-containing protein [Saccharopolyspora rhizosphaerae]